MSRTKQVSYLTLFIYSTHEINIYSRHTVSHSMIIWLIFKPEFSTFFFVIHQPSPSVGVSWWTVSSCGQIWSIREIIWIIILWSSYPPTVSSGLSCINHFLDNDNDDCMDNRYLRIIMFVQQDVLSAAKNAENKMFKEMSFTLLVHAVHS